MKKRMTAWLMVMMLLSTLFTPHAFAKTTQVLPGTNTLKAAVESASSGDVLELTDGLYALTSTLNIGKTLTIRAAEGTHPVISGGQTLTGWEKAEGNLYRVPYSGTTGLLLTENGTMGELARYPNRTETDYAVNGFIKATSAVGKTFYTNNIPAGLTTENLQIYTWGSVSWATSVLTVTEIGSNYLNYTGTVTYGADAGTRFYLRGNKALIDVPGEYAVSGGYLYYYPHNAASLTNGIVASGTSGTLVNITGSSVVLDGLDITLSTRGNIGISLRGGSNTVKNCEIYGIGSHGIAINGNGNTVTGNYLHEIGGSAIQINNVNNNTITNNKTVHSGMESGGVGAISLENGSGNLISHNDVSIAPRWAINMNCMNGGTNNIVEYNNCYQCNTESSDTGVIYTYYIQGDGNIIRNNAVHDSGVYYGFGFGIYLDDCSNHMEVYDNIVYNLQKNTGGSGYLFGPIMLKGIGNNFYNNLVVNNKADGGGDNNSSDIVIQELRPDMPTRENNIYENIIANNSTWNGYLYRLMCDRAAVNKVNDNLYYKPNGQYSTNGSFSGWSYSGWKNCGLDTDSVCANPQFVDFANGDYRLSKNSPAYALGFQDINMEDIGLTAEYQKADANDPLASLYVRNQANAGNRAWTVLKRNQTASLSVTGRTKNGYRANVTNVSYGSNNPGVATVDQTGKITAVSNGTATITVSGKAGGTTKSTTFTVTVSDSETEPTSRPTPTPRPTRDPSATTKPGYQDYYDFETGDQKDALEKDWGDGTRELRNMPTASDANNQAYYICQNDSGNQTKTKKTLTEYTDRESEILTITYDAKMSMKNNNSSDCWVNKIRVLDNDGSTWLGECDLAIFRQVDGNIQLQVNNVAKGSFRPDEWHSFAFSIDQQYDQYSVYMDGKAVVENQTIPQSYETKIYEGFLIAAGETAATNAWIALDNLGIYYGPYRNQPIPTTSPTTPPEVTVRVKAENVTALKGGTVEVPIVVTENSGMAGMVLQLSYDKALTLTGVKAGTALPDLTFTAPGNFSNNPVNLLWDGLEEDDSTGTAAILTFAVPDTEGTYQINLSCKAGDVYDGQLNNLGVELTGGTVTVGGRIPGDMNGDKLVDVKDITCLRRSIAGGYGITIPDDVANVNGDETVSVKDVTHLRRYIAGGYGVVIK